MKKILFSAAFILALSGLAAAQSTSSKQATSKQEKATVKKGPDTKSTGNKTTLKQESSSNAKADSTIRTKLPVPKPVDDTTSIPKFKQD